MSDIIDESQETYQDPYSEPDKDETMPELRQEETSNKPVRQISTMPKQKMQLQEYTWEWRYKFLQRWLESELSKWEAISYQNVMNDMLMNMYTVIIDKSKTIAKYQPPKNETKTL